MDELELARRADSRRVFELAGIGSIRLGGVFSRTATIAAGDDRFHAVRTSIWRPRYELQRLDGTVVARFEPRALRRGGVLEWRGRELTLRPASSWRERYALADGDRELAALSGRGWGKTPVAVAVADRAAVEPALLLFASYVVRALAEEAGTTAAAGGTAAVSG